MIWTVIYRDDASGRQGKVELEAANRGDVFLQMNKRKLRVLNVMEGRLMEEKPAKKKAAPTHLGRRLLFWIVFLLVAGGAAYWILRDSPAFQERLTRPEGGREPAGSVIIQPAAPKGSSPASQRETRVLITPAGTPVTPLEMPLRPRGEK